MLGPTGVGLVRVRRGIGRVTVSILRSKAPDDPSPTLATLDKAAAAGVADAFSSRSFSAAP